MAKRKRSKDSQKSPKYSVELTGLVLILIGIIGMGFGYIGSFIKQFMMFYYFYNSLPYFGNFNKSKTLSNYIYILDI